MPFRDLLHIEPSPLARELAHLVQVLDQLHKAPHIPPLPVVWTRSRREQGAYHSLSRPGRAVKITVSTLASFPALTLLHEIGH
jgi:hypothetical protein